MDKVVLELDSYRLRDLLNDSMKPSRKANSTTASGRDSIAVPFRDSGVQAWLQKGSSVEVTIHAQYPRPRQVKHEHLQLRRGGNYTELSGERALSYKCPATDLHRNKIALILWQPSWVIVNVVE